MHYILYVSKPTDQDIKANLPESMKIERDKEWYNAYIIALVNEIENIGGVVSANHFQYDDGLDEIRIKTNLDINTLNRIINPFFEKTDHHQGSWWCKLINRGIVQA